MTFNKGFPQNYDLLVSQAVFRTKSQDQVQDDVTSFLFHEFNPVMHDACMHDILAINYHIEH
jgi:hypothetical protein